MKRSAWKRIRLRTSEEQSNDSQCEVIVEKKMNKTLTVIIPIEVHNELMKNKKKSGATISFQVNQILKKELIKCRSRKSQN